MARSRFLLVVLAIAVALPAAAAAPSISRGSARPQGFRGEFLANLDEVEEKILDLAEALPAEKYSWRPAPGVRSTSEVFMHVAGGNRFLATFIGGKAPARSEADLEKTVTRKADVLAELRASFDDLRKAAAGVNDLEKPVKMFGTNTTARGVMITILSHLHEHLGQAIAYGRMNSVTPPWSR